MVALTSIGFIVTLMTIVIAKPFDALAPSTLSALVRRDDFGDVLVSCGAPSPGSSKPQCVCPIDLNGDKGVLINYFPGYQCAYKGGACTWADITGALQNTKQTNCPDVAPCPSTGCVCPTDNNGDKGVLIHQFKGFQCAYHGGACTWDNSGALSNIHQTNCPTSAKCVAPSSSFDDDSA